ncbi:HesB/IscA family protein [Microseira wollei]|uniref:Iron-sulfur cluster assembly accessory protein n=1 Tax=Microseira wollei NIES-4236 TaxID=2530354 RepID=A0AAV3X661_9CYAN|nr:iron-sulfur cluster assembly accessory protein [Microseira wollei]GET35575.1 iron-sulfur cluster assembly accessory protein [Microseira wollei NIES-4236]
MINLSPAAASEIKRLKSKHQKPNALFRLGVQPGGCAEMVYTLEFDETPAPGDRVYDCNGLSVVVAQQQLNYIDGLTLDYSEDMMGGGFRFHNPNAKTSCGCGNSFSIQG